MKNTIIMYLFISAIAFIGFNVILKAGDVYLDKCNQHFKEYKNDSF